ncbi:MAG: PKD domain-containing protein [Myxococcota bacterium]|nr:PKD domain-containing protein [Myxococcota bacterium]
MLLLLLACQGTPQDSGSPTLSPPQVVLGDALYVELGQPVTLDGSTSTGVAFVWYPGDGTQQAGAVVQHSYEHPGLYTAVLSVTGQDGSTRSDSIRVSVHLPLAQTAPTRSGMMQVQDGLAYVVIPEADQLSIVDLESGQVQEEEVCEHPNSVAHHQGSTAVACESELWVDGEVTLLPTGAHAKAVLAYQGGWLIAAQGLNQVLFFDGGLSVFAEVPDPGGLAWAGDRVVVGRFRAAQDRGSLWVIQEGEATEIPLPLDDEPDSDTTTGGVPNLIEQLCPSPDGDWVYVPALHSNSRRGPYLSGESLTHETAVVAVLGMVDLGAGEDTERRKQFDDKGRSIAAASSWDGNLLYVLHPGTQSVSVLDVWSGNQAGSIQDIGRGARDLWVAGERLYVYAWLDRELRVYDLSVSGQPPLVAQHAVLSQEPLDATVLAGKRLFWDSRDTRITRSGYLACTHCHPDGREDGRTWDFTDRGEGLRNTTSLEGRAGEAMGPMHWTGNFDEVQDFENDMRLHFGGTGLLSEEDWAECSDALGEPKEGRSEDLDALAAYVRSLDATPESPFGQPEGGEALFEASGCASCHPAPLYTDSALDVRHDVGTLSEGSGMRRDGPIDGLDTPTLLGAWDTAPYLHDGSAETVDAAIAVHNPGLDAETVAELAGFVRGL